jgi:hypothetical protein
MGSKIVSTKKADTKGQPFYIGCIYYETIISLA